MRLSRLTRLIELLVLLQSRRGHNTKNLADACRVSRRTIFRDLEVLRAAGVPFQYDDEQQRFYLPGGAVLPPTSFTTDEAISLVLLCHEMGGQHGLPFFDAARVAAMKIESSLPAQLREHLRHVSPTIEIDLPPRSSLTGSKSIYQNLLAAITGRRCVRISYRSLAEKRVISTKLSPYRILFTRRSWYVIGRSSLHRGTRTFNLGRVDQLDVLDESYRIPTGFSLGRYLRNAWHLIPEGRDCDVLIRFKPQVAHNVAEVVWHKRQRLAFNDDGSLDFHVRVSGIHEIAWWVLGYGDQAEVIHPAALREVIARHVAGLTSYYSAEMGKLTKAKLPAVAPRRKQRRPQADSG